MARASETVATTGVEAQMRATGFAAVTTLAGGLDARAREIAPRRPRS